VKSASHEPIGSTADDPAIRLMVYQIASVFGAADYALERYVADEAACKERLAELGCKPFGPANAFTPGDGS
jgi:hypothetical protein